MFRAPIQPNGCTWNASGTFGGPSCTAGKKSLAGGAPRDREAFIFAQGDAQVVQQSQDVLDTQVRDATLPRGPVDVYGTGLIRG